MSAERAAGDRSRTSEIAPQEQTTTEPEARQTKQATNTAALAVFCAAMIGFALKIAVAFSTLGTNDVVSFYRFAKSLTQHGLEWTYTNDIAFNHPPLVAYYLQFIYALSDLPMFQQNNITFPLLLRLPGIVADLLVVMMLFRLRQPLALPTWALVTLALSPVSLMVSGFHGNTDPIMVMFLVLAIYAAVRRHAVLCGIFLALSCQIKIVPLLLFPIFACFWLTRRKAVHFLLPFGLTMGSLWLQPLLQFPMLLVKNVLSYGSLWGLWGITYFLRLTGRPEFSMIGYYNLPAAERITVTLLKVLIICFVLLIAWRRRHLGARGLVDSVAIAWLTFFVFSPGVAPQYMVWIAPFVLILSPALGAYLMAGSSVFLFFFYNSIADKFPWYVGISLPEHVHLWAPWSVLPWALSLVALVVLWQKAMKTDRHFRLFSLEPVRDNPGR